MVLYFPVRKLYDIAKVSLLLVLVVTVLGLFEKWRGGKLAASAIDQFEQEYDTDILEDGSQDNFPLGERRHRTGKDQRNVVQERRYSGDSLDIPPLVDKFGEAAKAFAYCAAMAKHYASLPEDEQMDDRVLDEFVNCANIAHSVRATVTTCDMFCNDTALVMMNRNETEYYNEKYDPNEPKETTSRKPPIFFTTSCSREDYSHYLKECYKLYKDKVRWEDAKTNCENDGARLALFNIREEAAYLGEFAKDANDLCHIGVYKDDYGWSTINDENLIEAVGYEDVWENEPPEDAKWRYGALNNKGKLVAVLEDEEHPYICQMPEE